jgi:proprotein convertase subtilisin/kexin type 5
MCPAGTFFEYFQCKPCDSKCLTCEYTSGTSCTSCDVNSENPFLNGKDCSDTCPYGEFGNRDTATCEPCDYPCEQCVDTSSTCTSCRQDSLDKFYFENQCLAECPPGQYTESEARDNVCLPCSENCLTCELSADSCTSCPASQILNNLDGTCVQSCPEDLSIYSPKNATHPIDTCEPCTSSCKTCKFDTFHCTSCRDPLSLRPWESTCVLECDVFYQSSVSIDNVCVGCSSSCSACQNQPDYCLECVTGTYFYQNKCLQ